MAACYNGRMGLGMTIVAPIILAASVTSSDWVAASHPHVIRDAHDAIETASIQWKARYPQSGARNDLWQQEFTAKLTGDVWVIRQKMTAPDNPQGTVIRLDAKDGHIVSAEIID
jgi:hypothetical protein